MEVMRLLVFVCVCVYVCADMGTTLENGEQEAHGVQKPGKKYPTIPSAVNQSAKATRSSSSRPVFSCLSTLVCFLLVLPLSSIVCVCVCP